MVKKSSGDGGRLGMPWDCLGLTGAAVDSGKAVFLPRTQWQLGGMWC